MFSVPDTGISDFKNKNKKIKKKKRKGGGKELVEGKWITKRLKEPSVLCAALVRLQANMIQRVTHASDSGKK